MINRQSIVDRMEAALSIDDADSAIIEWDAIYFVADELGLAEDEEFAALSNAVIDRFLEAWEDERNEKQHG